MHTIKQNQEVVEHLLDKTKEDAIERSESYNKLVTHMGKKQSLLLERLCFYPIIIFLKGIRSLSHVFLLVQNH